MTKLCVSEIAQHWATGPPPDRHLLQVIAIEAQLACQDRLGLLLGQGQGCDDVAGREGGGRLDHDGCCSVGVLAGYDNLDFLLGTEIKDTCISLEEQGCLRELLWGIGVLICKHSVL